MADYSPPTLSDLWALIGRDLTDPDHKVFNTSQLTDYINGGIAELNRVRPLETVVTTGYDGDSDTVPLGPLPIDDPFVVEMMDNDYFAHTLVLGPAYSEHVLRMCRDNGWTLRIWGYRGRDPLILDDDGAEFNALEEEYAVRLYARMEAYRSLNVDRGLFQQWQQQANNSDVSPTQLNGMLVTAEGSFDRQQKRLFLPRRLPMV
jgi:hypothetical protein